MVNYSEMLLLDRFSNSLLGRICPTSCLGVNPSAAGECAPILSGSWAAISAVGKRKYLECHVKNRQSSFLLSYFPFLSIVLTVLKNDAAKGKTCKTTEYNLSKAVIQNCFNGTYAIPPVRGGHCMCGAYIVLPIAEGLINFENLLLYFFVKVDIGIVIL